MSSGIYGLIGTLIGAALTLITTWLTQRAAAKLESNKIAASDKQLIFRDKVEKTGQFAADICAACYSFLWITTYNAGEHVDKESLNIYFDDIQKIMPRIYSSYVMLAAFDDSMATVGDALVKRADDLDFKIGEAAKVIDKDTAKRLSHLNVAAVELQKETLETLVHELTKSRPRLLSDNK